MGLFVSDHRFIQFTLCSCYAVRINACLYFILNVYIERNNIQVELKRFRNNSDFISVGNFEVGIYFRDRRADCYCSVQGAPGAPDVSAHDHFGTRHFGTYSTLGHAQFRT